MAGDRDSDVDLVYLQHLSFSSKISPELGTLTTLSRSSPFSSVEDCRYDLKLCARGPAAVEFLDAIRILGTGALCAHVSFEVYS